MHRRVFLQSLASIAATGALPQSLVPQLAFRPAAANTGRTLVIMFLRGACDGLNVVVPYGEDAYYRARRSIAVAPPGQGNGAALDLDGFFGLHPALATLYGRYVQGEICLLPTVHHQGASRSHFVAQDAIEVAGGEDGWLNRYLDVLGSSAGLGGLALGPSVQRSLQGAVTVSAFEGLEDSGLAADPAEEQRILAHLERHYRGEGATDPASLVRLAGELGFSNIRFLRSYSAALENAGSATYPATHLGRQLADLARLIKADLGLSVAALDMHGWDTHRVQGNGEPGGRQAALLAEFAHGLDAFLADLGPRRSETIIVVMTEFGRTLAQNASGGTDHGGAAAWWVIGGGVRGGLNFGGGGQWPGLEPSQLYEERELRFTIDYRDVLAACLHAHSGLDWSQMSRIFPGFSTVPAGLF